MRKVQKIQRPFSGHAIIETLDIRRLLTYTVNFSDTLGETVSIQWSSSHSAVYFSDGASTYYTFTLSGTTYTRSGTSSTPQYIDTTHDDLSINLLGGSDHFWENSGYAGPDYTLSGGNGNDTLQGGFHTDEMNGNGGNDVIDVFDSDAFVIAGNDGADSIVAGAGDNGGNGNHYVFVGGNGNDTLDVSQDSGTNSFDDLEGDADDDVLKGSAGKDFLSGNDGNDLIYSKPGSGDNDQDDGGTGTDTVQAHDASDNLFSIEVING